MYGISSGIALGFGHFIFTSRVKRSTDVAVLTFGVTTMAYWMYCRYHWTKKYFMSQKMQASLHELMLKENPTDSTDV
uniref:Cytochrome c oxidase assembly protein COX20, mitochondrial n=1 Tax=Lycosa singoriensis TaxID=434756 RepID=A9QQ77_LYCSI|nr:unkown [Lycosa singoriensis]